VLVDGTEVVTSEEGTTTNVIGPPVVAMEQCEVQTRLELVDGEWRHRWDYARQALAVVKLFTGGWSVARWRTLWELSGSATEILDPYATPPYDWPTPMRMIAPERIRLGTIGLLSANGYRFLELAKGETVDLSPAVPGVSHARHDVAGLERVLYSYCDAAIPTNRMRTNVGVGETVFITSVPELPAETSWETTAGSLAAQTNATAHWTAPSNAHNVTITATLPDGYKARKHFKVWEPSGIEKSVIYSTLTNTYSVGSPGAIMRQKVWVGPTTVSLSRVWVREVPGPATSIWGAYTNVPPASLYHGTAGYFSPLTAENTFNDTAAEPGLPPPWFSGGYTWVIPMQWKVGAHGINGDLPSVSQVVTINSDGTVSITKYSNSVSRGTNGVSNPSL